MDRVKIMQTLLNDIELDIQELKYLVQAIASETNPALRRVAKRNIQQMKARLDALLSQLEEAPEAPAPVVQPVAQPATPPLPVAEPAPQAEPAATILAERIKPGKELRQSISLNDSFRFTRELFAGDAARMNEVVNRLGTAPSLEKAMEIFLQEVHPDEENEAAADFVELLKKHFC